MQANFYRPIPKPESASRFCNLARGFTLLELLVVVVVVAILFTYTTLAIRSDSPEDVIKKEAQRMGRLVQLALEESILRGEEYGIEPVLPFVRHATEQCVERVRSEVGGPGHQTWRGSCRLMGRRFRQIPSIS